MILTKNTFLPLIADGFNLPLESEAYSKEWNILTTEAGSGTFQKLMDRMRDAATLSLLERLQHLPKGSHSF